MKSQRNLIAVCAAVTLTLIVAGCGKPKIPAGGKSSASENPAAVVSNTLAALSAAGDPVTLEELSRQYAEPPAGENAAPLYEQAFAAINDEDPKSPAFLAHNQKALPVLFQAAERKSCRYPIVLTDGSATKLPHLAKVKKAAGLLKAEAVSQAARGRTDASAKALLAGLSLARSLEQEPITISMLVQIASLRLTLEGLEQALTARAFAETQLLSLQTAVGEAESSISFRRALIGERAFLIGNFQLPDAELAKAMAQTGEHGTLSAEVAAYRKTEKFHHDFAFALDYLSKLIVLSEMPCPQALDADAQKTGPRIETAVSEDYLLSKMLLPALNGCATKRAEGIASIRLAQAGVAIERYRLKHANALPGSLSDLKPDYLTTVPADPFDGHPLRYQKLPGKGYVVYSIGKNRTDDGGAEQSPDGKTQLDLVFTVKR